MLEKQQAAAQCLQQMALATKGAFLPYLEQCAKICVENLLEHFEKDSRAVGIDLLGALVKVGHGAGHVGVMQALTPMLETLEDDEADVLHTVPASAPVLGVKAFQACAAMIRQQLPCQQK